MSKTEQWLGYQQRKVRELLPSTTRAEVVLDSLDIPKDQPHGLTIVDIAAGASSFVPWLLDQGANAFAIDQAYALSTDELSKIVDQYTQQAVEIAPQEWKNFLTKESKESKEQFWKSFYENRGRFISAWMTDLPIIDSVSDITTSFSGVTSLARDDIYLYERIVNEAIRITKSGGSIRLAPFDQRGIDGALFRRLESRRKDLSVFFERSSNPRFAEYGRIRIDKH